MRGLSPYIGETLYIETHEIMEKFGHLVARIENSLQKNILECACKFGKGGIQKHETATMHVISIYPLARLLYFSWNILECKMYLHKPRHGNKTKIKLL